MPHQAYQLAAGSVIGRDHRLVSKNCQDGFYIFRDDRCTVGIVTDGCGSSTHSEVGAKLGARLVAESIQEEVWLNPEAISWQRIRRQTLAALEVLARQMGGNFVQTVQDYFLFTVVGVLLTGNRATFFALGDGVVIVNGVRYPLGPYADNAPPYLGYGLIGEVLRDQTLGDIPIGIIAEMSLIELDAFLIGSDGVIDLIAAAAQTQPGSTHLVGSINQFWTEESIFKNPELVNRRLKLIARDWPHHNPDPGRLPDDTTLIVGRRSPQVAQ
jgi:hypothetical protein